MSDRFAGLTLAEKAKLVRQWFTGEQREYYVGTTMPDDQVAVILEVAESVPREAIPAAWATEDGERVVTERTHRNALADGGAIASSMAPYSVPLFRHPPERPAPSEPTADEREALRVLVEQADLNHDDYPSATPSPRKIADAILAAGYRRPPQPSAAREGE